MKVLLNKPQQVANKNPSNTDSLIPKLAAGEQSLKQLRHIVTSEKVHRNIKMKKATILFACIFWATFTFNAVAQSQSSENKVIAGQSMGQIKIGDPSKTVLNLYGQPTKIYNKSVGIQEYFWNLTKSESDSQYEELRVIIASDRVIQIKTTSPKDVLPGGYSTNTSLAQVLQKYKNLTPSVYGVEDKEDAGGYEAYFYDDVKLGVAFMIAAQDNFNHSTPVSAIYIHRPNKPVMPDINSTPAKPILNQPEQPVKPVAKKPQRQKPTIKLKKIHLNGHQRQAASNALHVLRRLESIVKVGVTYNVYVNHVADAQADIDEYLRAVPRSDIRNELQKSMYEYGSAARGWSDWISGNVPESISDMVFGLNVRDHWSQAKLHAQNAAQLF